MKRLPLLLILSCLFIPAFSAQANPFEWLRLKQWEFEVRAGVNLGGVSPLPFPQEVRKIDKFNPKFNGMIGFVGTNWLQEHWGVSLGLFFEQKGMETEAEVKNYHMEIAEQGRVLAGNWTGKVRSSFSASYLTMPVQLVYRLNPSIRFNAGLYLGYRFDGDFSGDVYDGYFRQGSSTGEKIVFGKETRTPYSFKEHLSSMEIGFTLGGSAKVYRRFLLFASLKCGFNNIFKGSFTAITYKMYPVYMSTGFGYLF